MPARPKDVLAALLDLLFPRRCPACDALADRSTGFCPACSAALVRAPPRACPLCGVPSGAAGPALPCAACRARRPPFRRAGAAFLFGGPLADAVARFKAGGVPEFPGIVAPELARAARRLWRDDAAAPPPDLAVAVPPDPRRLALRGFDPGTLVARAAARRLGLQLAAGVLRSTPRPRAQRELSRDERLRALRGVFRPAPAAGRVLHGRHVLLLDDVRTTGATVATCARALRGAGAATVRVATLALVE